MKNRTTNYTQEGFDSESLIGRLVFQNNLLFPRQLNETHLLCNSFFEQGNNLWYLFVNYFTVSFYQISDPILEIGNERGKCYSRFSANKIEHDNHADTVEITS